MLLGAAQVTTSVMIDVVVRVWITVVGGNVWVTGGNVWVTGGRVTGGRVTVVGGMVMTCVMETVDPG